MWSYSASCRRNHRQIKKYIHASAINGAITFPPVLGLAGKTLQWAARGFRVFPLAVGSKKPAWKDWDWTEKASADPEVISR